MKLALCQTNIIWEDKNANIKRLEAYVEEASRHNGDIILFPEMSLTGFSQNIALTKERGESVDIISSAAKRHNIAIGIGWVRDCGSKGENVYTVSDSSGKVMSEYTKLHPFSYSGENKNFISGDNIAVFSYKGFNIGILICYDLRFPEVFQAVSDKADIIIVPACWPKKRSDHWKTLLKARAIENQCYIVGVNCVGDIGGLSYSGDSCVIDPEGRVLNMLSNKEGILYADIDNDVKMFRAEFPTKNDRRNDLYKKLL